MSPGGEGWAGVLTYLALASGRWCYAAISTLSWNLRHVTRGWGWAGVLTYLALASGRWCYAKSTLSWNLRRVTRGEGWAGVLTYLALASGRWCYAKSTLSWNLRRVTRGEGWAGVLTYLALASGRWCYANSTLSWNLRHVTRGWGVGGCVNVPGTCVWKMMLAKSTLCWNLQGATPNEFYSALKRLPKATWLCNAWKKKTVDLQTKSTHFLWGKKPEPVRNSPCNCEFRSLITCKKTNSWGRLENTFHVELRMGKQHEIFPPMELRVSKLVWWSHIFPIGMINIQYHENVKNTMPYQGPIWAVDLVSLS